MRPRTMARPLAETLTGREAELMDAIWRLGEATAEQVREALPYVYLIDTKTGRLKQVVMETIWKYRVWDQLPAQGSRSTAAP